MSLFSRKPARTAYTAYASTDGGAHTVSFCRDTRLGQTTHTTYTSREEAERVAADLLSMFPKAAVSVYRAR